MHITNEGWFEITWYLGFFSVFRVRPPVEVEILDDDQEESVQTPAPVQQYRPGADEQCLLPQPACMWRFV